MNPKLDRGAIQVLVQIFSIDHPIFKLQGAQDYENQKEDFNFLLQFFYKQISINKFSSERKKQMRAEYLKSLNIFSNDKIIKFELFLQEENILKIEKLSIEELLKRGNLFDRQVYSVVNRRIGEDPQIHFLTFDLQISILNSYHSKIAGQPASVVLPSPLNQFYQNDNFICSFVTLK